MISYDWKPFICQLALLNCIIICAVKVTNKTENAHSLTVIQEQVSQFVTIEFDSNNCLERHIPTVVRQNHCAG